MHILPLHTRLLQSGDDLAAAISGDEKIQPGDIVVVSSKALATVTGASIALPDAADVNDEANAIAKRTGQTPAFVEAILRELSRLNGKIVGECPGAVLTEVSPQGMTGSILVANAGLDQSNAKEGTVVGWPQEPIKHLASLRQKIEAKAGGKIALILSDSCCLPRRRGVIAIALCASGIDPLLPQKGQKDLFSRALRLTDEAICDQLATAANSVMGNAAQSTPAAIIRDHGIPLSDFEGWVPGISRDEDLFTSL